MTTPGDKNMNKPVFASLLLLLLTSATPLFASEPLQTEEQKTLYAIGLTVSRQLAIFDLSPAELNIVTRGITDAGSGKKLQVELATYSDKIQDLARSRRKAMGEKMAVVNKSMLEKAAQEKNAVTTASGLVYLPLREGTGATPKATDTVRAHYRGWLADGKEFDNSYKRDKPLEFKLDAVIKCWSEGLQKMKTGGKAKLTCPSSLAYGETGAGDVILPGSTLSFEVELVDIKK
jgi:FKBP-type peptidyl-prolyl cis-trans isomerase FkpA